MKILGIIFAVLMLLASAFVSGAGAHKASNLANTITGLTSNMPAAEKETMSKEVGIPSTGRIKTGAIVSWLAALAALALLVAAFVKKDKVPLLAGLAIAIPVAAALIFPHVDTGPTDGWAPRTQSLIAAALALVGAGGAWLAARRKA